MLALITVLFSISFCFSAILLPPVPHHVVDCDHRLSAEEYLALKTDPSSYLTSIQSHWFRETQPLNAFQHHILPRLKGARELRIAHVGASDGHEPLSVLMMNWSDRGWFRQVGYDLNPEVLSFARDGVYTISRDYDPDMQRLLAEYRDETDAIFSIEEFVQHRRRHFRFTVKPEIKDRLSYQFHNILLSPLPRKADVIFLSNVLVHYRPAGREMILRNVAQSLLTGGYLTMETNPGDLTPRRQQVDAALRKLGFRRSTEIRIPIDIFGRRTSGPSRDIHTWTQVYRLEDRPTNPGSVAGGQL